MIGAEFLPSYSLNGEVYFMGFMGHGYFWVMVIWIIGHKFYDFLSLPRALFIRLYIYIID